MSRTPNARVQSAAGWINLPSLRTVGVHDEGEYCLVEATVQCESAICPACGHADLYRHGKQPQRFVDTPVHGKRVVIEVQRQRYRCTMCGKTQFAALPDMDGKRFATARLIRYLEQRCLTQTFAALGRQVGVDERTVRHVFDDYVARIKRAVTFETPEVLGIDELTIAGRRRVTVANAEKIALYDLLATCKPLDLITYFEQLPDKHRVRALTMEIGSAYRAAAETQFPDRLIVADRRSVLCMADEAVEKTRKAVRKTLNTRARLKLKDDRVLLSTRWHRLSSEQQSVLVSWECDFPRLGAAYRVKEAFHDLYGQDNRNQAEVAAKDWVESIPQELRDAFGGVVQALHNGWTEVFNWYECRISNNYSASIDRMAANMSRIGRGYSFDVARAWLIFDESVLDCADTGNERVRDVSAPEASLPRHIITHGACIPTLCDRLESGHFE